MIALKKRKKIYLTGFCVLLVAIAIVSVKITLALNTVKQPISTNVATIGEIKIKLIDEYYEASDMTKNHQTYDKDHPPVFKRGDDVTKTVYVQNVGEHPCYVRLLVRKEWVYQDPDTLALFDLDNPTGDAEEEDQIITWTVNDEWVRGKPSDDYPDYYIYYYKTPLSARGGKTQSLFKDNQFHIGRYDLDAHIYVMAQAVQSDSTKGFF